MPEDLGKAMVPDVQKSSFTVKPAFATLPAMNTVQEIESAIGKLGPVERSQLVRDLPRLLPELDGEAAWAGAPSHGGALHLDLEADSPELEAELLKSVRGPHAPFSETELRGLADRARQEHRTRGGK